MEGVGCVLAAADAHAARGEWADAVRERLRAVVRSLEERAVLDERPGRTADEAAAEAGTALPTCADDLRRSARLFDDIWGARNAGLRSIHIPLSNIPRQQVGHSEGEPDAVVHALSEIATVVAEW